MEGHGGGQVFEGVSYAIIPSDKLDSQQITNKLSSGGATLIPLRDDNKRIDDLADVTHIISSHIDFPQYCEAVDCGIHVVRPSWVDTSMRKGKQAGARQHSPDPSQFFQDVTVTFAELPEGDKDAIAAGVMAMGGLYSSPLSKLVTHVVTTDPEHDKCMLAIDKKVNCKIVLPHWFDDCLKLGRKISEKPYMFPDPTYLQNLPSRPANSDSLHLDGATVATPNGVPTTGYLDTPPSSPADSRKNLNAFMGRKVRLGKDLGLNQHLANTLETLINFGGGTLTDKVEEADIYIGKYRDGNEYVTASRAGKEVANLSWLYHVITHNKYTNPVTKLLHYPVPRNGIRGFENMRISISNYNGDTRVYLENLIIHCGAEFTKTMKQDNTHLITAHQHSEKVEAAQEWNIHIVNASWIEESYANCTVQSLTVPKYTHFPPKTHLGEVCGQVQLNMKVMEQVYFPKPKASPQKPTPIVQPTEKSKASPRKTLPASSVACGGETTREKMSPPLPISEDAETEDEDEPEPERESEPQTAKKPRGRPRKSANATPRIDDEKENQSPMWMSSGRASKTKARDSMHKQADDIALFQREMKRKGGVTHGGRRSSNQELSSPAPAPKGKKKRKSDEATYDVTAEGSDLSDGETQDKTAKANKKAKHTSAKHTTTNEPLPPIQYRMIVTGDERWVSNPRAEDADKLTLRQLGIQLTTDPSQVDILVAPKILRTRKFVAALASAPLVVDSTFLDHALQKREILPKPSPLQDREGEERLGFTLASALTLAKQNDHKLLAGWSIFVTRDVPGGFETYKEIINLNGGEAYLYAGRTGLTLPKPKEDEHVYLVTGTSEAEKRLWKAFGVLAEKQGVRWRVVRNDWVLQAAMSQRVQWKEEWSLI